MPASADSPARMRARASSVQWRASERFTRGWSSSDERTPLTRTAGTSPSRRCRSLAFIEEARATSETSAGPSSTTMGRARTGGAEATRTCGCASEAGTGRLMRVCAFEDEGVVLAAGGEGGPLPGATAPAAERLLPRTKSTSSVPGSREVMVTWKVPRAPASWVASTGLRVSSATARSGERISPRRSRMVCSGIAGRWSFLGTPWANIFGSRSLPMRSSLAPWSTTMARRLSMRAMPPSLARQPAFIFPASRRHTSRYPTFHPRRA